MLKRIFSRGFQSIQFSVPARGFVNVSKENSRETEHLYNPMLETFSKRLRKIVLDRTILEKHKLVVPSVRVRQVDDTLEKLRNSRLCAGVINGRDEFEDVDLVFQSRQINILKGRKDSKVQSYYLRVGDELVRCTLEDVQVHYVHNWIIQAKFNRYIPGRPNLIWLPLKLQHNYENKFINKGADIALKYEGLWVYSYNDEYPAAIEVNPTTATPAKGYKLGELANLLPDGIELHEKHKKELHNYVIELGITKDIELEKELEYLEFKKKMKSGEVTFAEDDFVEEEFDESGDEETPEEKAAKEALKAAREAKKAKMREESKKNPKSLKKQVAQMNFKVKEGFLAATEDKPKKGSGDNKEG